MTARHEYVLSTIAHDRRKLEVPGPYSNDQISFVRKHCIHAFVFHGAMC